MTRRQSCTEYWLDTRTGTFRGDFEAMYRDIDDPWGCEAGKSSLDNRVFVDIIFDSRKGFQRILDIGCGLGGLLNTIKLRNDGGGYVMGVDVSPTAVDKARANYPDLTFQCRNVVHEEIGERDFDLVVLSEVLWYVLESLPLFFDRVIELMAVRGTLAIHQFFPTEQRYGKAVLDGLPGFQRFMEDRAGLPQQHVYTSHHRDGLVLLSTFTKER